jgi:hypothetical protein
MNFSLSRTCHYSGSHHHAAAILDVMATLDAVDVVPQ